MKLYLHRASRFLRRATRVPVTMLSPMAGRLTISVRSARRYSLQKATLSKIVSGFCSPSTPALDTPESFIWIAAKLRVIIFGIGRWISHNLSPVVHGFRPLNFSADLGTKLVAREAMMSVLKATGRLPRLTQDVAVCARASSRSKSWGQRLMAVGA